MKRLLVALLVLFAWPAWAQSAATGTAPAPAQVRPAKLPASAFAARSGYEDAMLSPDGKLIVLTVTNLKGETGFAFVDAATKKPLKLIFAPFARRIGWLRWAGNRRVVMSLVGADIPAYVDFVSAPLVTIDLDDGKHRAVGNNKMKFLGGEVVYIDPEGQYVLQSIYRVGSGYPSVWRFPLDPAAKDNGSLVQSSRTGVYDWHADSQGVVRMGILSTKPGEFKVLYRSSDKQDFKSIGKIREDSTESEFLDVVGIISGSDEGLILKQDESGKVVLRKYNYVTRTTGETIFAAPDRWDVDEVSLDGENRPIAAYYTDDRERVHWFNPEMKSLHERFGRAFKGKDVWITSRSRDNSRMILWAGSENDPGGYYIYDAAKGSIDLFYGEKGLLDPAELPVPQPVTYTARDGTPIRAYLTLPLGRSPKGLPLIVLPHGGPYGVRDKLTFDTEVQFLANRGYAVIQPNYRGSDGYGSTFSDLGDGQIGRKMQDDLDDAMDWAVAQGYADPKRVCMVGTSYGGYAALWAVTRNPERYRCAASFAGVTDWKQQLSYDSRFLSKGTGRSWKSRVRGEGGKFDMDAVSPAPLVSRLTRPVLLAHGEKDDNVPFRQFKLLRDAAALAGKPLEVLTFPEEGHGFDKEENETKWLETLEAFLAKHNPAD